VAPSGPVEDYGWILAAPSQHGIFRRVERFVEKPAREVAAQLMAAGASWNTLVLVARARTMFELYRRHLPGLTAVFAEALALPAADRDTFLSLQYPELPALDLSRHLLTPALELETCTWPQTIGWADLGTPERLERWLARAPQAAPAADLGGRFCETTPEVDRSTMRRWPAIASPG
jgi:mannose-1-phosphate guanylyltransferase